MFLCHLRQAHPVLAAVLESPRWRLHASVVDAACEVYQKTLLCVKVRLLFILLVLPRTL